MLKRKGWMNFRTSYLNRISSFIVCALLLSLTPQSIAEPLKITGPDGQSRQQNRQYGPTTKADTFWSIAQKMRPNNKVSIYQVMAAIYDANPHAFTSSNYNSLEVGMILLVPPAEKMLAIPVSIARERAEQDDKSWKQRAQPSKQVTQKAKPKRKPKPIEEQIAEAKAEPESPQKIMQLTLLLEREESKVISLTDELSRTQDELTMAKDDLDALKDRLAELSDKVDLLEGTLTETRQLNASLKAENKILQDTLALEKEEKPTDLWRSLLDSPLTLAVIAIVPALLFVLLIFALWRRKQSSNEEVFTEDTHTEPTVESNEEVQPQDIDLDPVIEPVIEEDNVDDFFEEVAVQLDDEEPEDTVEALEEPEESNTEPETSITESDMDDLWAEALDEQIDGKEISSDVEELLNKLDEPEEKINENDVEASTDVQEELVEQVDESTLDSGSVSDGLDELIDSTEIDLEDPFLDDEALNEFESSENEADEVNLDELINSMEAEQDDTDNDLEATSEAEEIFLEEPEIEASLESKETITETDELQEESELSDEQENIELESTSIEGDIDSLDFVSPVMDDVQSLPESDSGLEAEIETEVNEDVQESELPSPDVEASSDENMPEAELDTTLPEPNENIDDLDALMAEFDVDVPSQAQESNLPEATSMEVEASLEEPETVSFSEPDPVVSTENISDFDEGQTDENENSSQTEFESEHSLSDDIAESEDTALTFEDHDEDTKTELSDIDLGMDFESVSESTDNSATTPSPSSTSSKSEALPDLDFDMDLNDEELFESFAQVSDEIKHTEALLSSDMDLSKLETDGETKTASFEGDNMTVDEALAALDDEIGSDINAEKISGDDLSNFQKENGYIDIDKLLNESSEESTEVDPYKEVDVNLGESSELESLFESNPMVDVDDAENSVNAKLDLARAYIEIDDKDSAKALLEEIQIDGNDRQKSEAIELLTTIS
ncbi:hypothetical protein SOPP22_08295 [Shewanella sp. OPT22]|nr:hypothetical protein SOPP22_08295 [Shewanella sp. OPT22]